MGRYDELDKDVHSLYDMIAAHNNSVRLIESDLESIINPIAITSFIISPSTVEIGANVPQVQVSWSFNKNKYERQVLNGVDIELDRKSITDEGPFTSDKTYTLTVKDGMKEVTLSKTLTFCNNIYYGVSALTSYESSILDSLTKTLRTSKNGSYSFNAGPTQYLYFICPARLGTPIFNVGGFEGGFNDLGSVEITNSSGYTESYKVYRSTNPGLGSTTVNIS